MVKVYYKGRLGMKDIGRLRGQFPITKSKVFLNHAACSPLPKPVADAMRKSVDEFSAVGIMNNDLGESKKLFVRLINAASHDEVAFVENTSMGLNIVAHVLNYPSCSNIVTTDLEYPSVVYPWLGSRIGVEVRYVKNVNGKILLNDVERMVDDKTIAVAVSHVEYVNGFRHDLRALADIAHEHGAYLIVDAIQSAGVIPVDVRRDNVDFLTTACYKWLLGPVGTGFLYVRHDLIQEFEPSFIGWASVKPEVFETLDFWDIRNLKLAENACRFEVGTPSFFSLVGAATALKLLLDVKISNIEKRVLALTSRLIEAVKDRGLRLQTPEEPSECRSGVVNFVIDKPRERVERLEKKGIVVSARAHGIRVSPHFYNTEEEIDKLVDEL